MNDNIAFMLGNSHLYSLKCSQTPSGNFALPSRAKWPFDRVAGNFFFGSK